MKTTKIIQYLSLIIYLIIRPALNIYKKRVEKRFNIAKSKAIEDAIRMRDDTKSDIHVVQVHSSFKVGNRAELRRFNKRGTKFLEVGAKREKLPYNCMIFDWKKATIFTAHSDGRNSHY